ncbi:unnamed protein product, partial [Gulo gulo]
MPSQSVAWTTLGPSTGSLRTMGTSGAWRSSWRTWWRLSSPGVGARSRERTCGLQRRLRAWPMPDKPGHPGDLASSGTGPPRLFRRRPKGKEGPPGANPAALSGRPQPRAPQPNKPSWSTLGRAWLSLPGASTAAQGPDGRGRCGPRSGSHLGGRVLQSPAWAMWEAGLLAREAGLGSEGLVFRHGPTRGSRCYATSKCPEGLGTAVLEIHRLPGTVAWPWAGHVTGSSLCVHMVGFGRDLFY